MYSFHPDLLNQKYERWRSAICAINVLLKTENNRCILVNDAYIEKLIMEEFGCKIIVFFQNY